MDLGLFKIGEGGGGRGGEEGGCVEGVCVWGVGGGYLDIGLFKVGG